MVQEAVKAITEKHDTKAFMWHSVEWLRRILISGSTVAHNTDNRLHVLPALAWDSSPTIKTCMLGKFSGQRPWSRRWAWVWIEPPDAALWLQRTCFIELYFVWLCVINKDSSSWDNSYELFILNIMALPQSWSMLSHQYLPRFWPISKKKLKVQKWNQ